MGIQLNSMGAFGVLWKVQSSMWATLRKKYKGKYQKGVNLTNESHIHI
jgi:hypothetical protein